MTDAHKPRFCSECGAKLFNNEKGQCLGRHRNQVK